MEPNTIDKRMEEMHQFLADETQPQDGNKTDETFFAEKDTFVQLPEDLGETHDPVNLDNFQ